MRKFSEFMDSMVNEKSEILDRLIKNHAPQLRKLFEEAISSNTFSSDPDFIRDLKIAVREISNQPQGMKPKEPDVVILPTTDGGVSAEI